MHPFTPITHPLHTHYTFPRLPHPFIFSSSFSIQLCTLLLLPATPPHPVSKQPPKMLSYCSLPLFLITTSLPPTFFILLFLLTWLPIPTLAPLLHFFASFPSPHLRSQRIYFFIHSVADSQYSRYFYYSLLHSSQRSN